MPGLLLSGSSGVPRGRAGRFPRGRSELDDHAVGFVAAAGRDCQLEAAVQVALEALDARPAAAVPDPAARRPRRRQPLPPGPAR